MLATRWEPEKLHWCTVSDYLNTALTRFHQILSNLIANILYHVSITFYTTALEEVLFRRQRFSILLHDLINPKNITVWLLWSNISTVNLRNIKSYRLTKILLDMQSFTWKFDDMVSMKNEEHDIVQHGQIYISIDRLVQFRSGCQLLICWSQILAQFFQIGLSINTPNYNEETAHCRKLSIYSKMIGDDEFGLRLVKMCLGCCDWQFYSFSTYKSSRLKLDKCKAYWWRRKELLGRRKHQKSTLYRWILAPCLLLNCITKKRIHSQNMYLVDIESWHIELANWNGKHGILLYETQRHRHCLWTRSHVFVVVPYLMEIRPNFTAKNCPSSMQKVRLRDILLETFLVPFDRGDIV